MLLILNCDFDMFFYSMLLLKENLQKNLYHGAYYYTVMESLIWSLQTEEKDLIVTVGQLGVSEGR